ncbi:MAG: protein kinase, partial [Myxococcota bacterium]
MVIQLVLSGAAQRRLTMGKEPTDHKRLEETAAATLQGHHHDVPPGESMSEVYHRHIPGWVGMELAGRYRLMEVIGEGGMGVVYRAEHLKTGGSTAIKIIHGDATRAWPRAAQRFELEARHQASLNHPNIVQVFDYGQEHNLLYLVMEFVPGASIQHMLEKRGAMEWHRVVRMVEQ